MRKGYAMPSCLEKFSLDWSEDSIRLINTPSQKAKSIYYYMQEAGYFKTKPPYFTEREGLPSFLILFTVSGTGLLQYENMEYTLEKDQCFFINCMEHHKYHTKITGENSCWEFLWVHFYGSNSLGYYQEFCKNGFSIVKPPDSSSFASLFHQIISVNQKKQLDCEVLTSKLLTDLLTGLCTVNARGGGEILLMPDYIKHTLKYIDTHFRDDLSLTQLAALCSLSQYHLSREFRKYVSIPVNEYIISRRINYAKELLKYTATPVSEIAFACGMRNISHFINLFKAREGTTPLIYRRYWNQNLLS